MKKKYVICMKNGNKIEIEEAKYTELNGLLMRERPPQFIGISGNVINSAAISYCAIEEDRSW
jgi:hypothetical protein